jgi:hypothetical protein
MDCAVGALAGVRVDGVDGTVGVVGSVAFKLQQHARHSCT